MKNKFKRILSCLVFTALCVAAIATCADFLENKKARIKYTPFYESKTNYDVIFLGTSRMYNTVFPMELWKEYGIASYNWGYSNCTIAENYYLIQDIVNYTSPKVIVLDLYGLVEYDKYNNGKYRTDRIEQQHVQFDSLPIWSRSKIEASRDVFDDYEGRDDFIWNFIMYHNRWTELGKTDFVYSISTEKGAKFINGLGKGTFTLLSADEKTQIESVCYTYFLRLLEWCQEKDIPVLCVYLPYTAKEKAQRVANSVGDIVQEYAGCSYVNMLNKGILDFNTDIYSDNSHLNYSGALKTTLWLGQYLVEHYDLDDYSDNESWKADYASYHAYKENTLRNLGTLPGYLIQLRDTDFQAELEVYDQRLLDINRFTALCKNAGIQPVYTKSDGKACARLTIYSSGEQLMEVFFSNTASGTIDIMEIVKAT